MSGSGVDPRLLEIVVCPDCRSSLVEEAVAAGAPGRPGSTGDGTGLRCQGCGLLYPVRDSIPVLLVDEATRTA